MKKDLPKSMIIVPIITFRWLRNQKEQPDVVAFYEKRDFMDRQI